MSPYQTRSDYVSTFNVPAQTREQDVERARRVSLYSAIAEATMIARLHHAPADLIELLASAESTANARVTAFDRENPS